ncbi:MAG: homoserine dehydrogenase [Deltaproteobacteria bacterium]|nr:homoserine dehydrogenase [Deltaproteobacteria bacterium]MBW2075210.1 homoserine dehydrogenase [Deltaproteobacteria bacterium]RLB81198.1 MAG: homoserine dehydrogenase [Deltaproteobacteria bacterium]
MKKIHIGLLGFGTVGSGMVKILLENREVIESRLGASLTLKWIAARDLEKDRGVAVDASLLTTDAEMVIDDPEIDIVVELIGGYEPSKRFILKAIENGKQIVTANKALLAAHGDEIFSAASRKGVEVGFEASVGGGIPLIRSIKEGLVANRIRGLFGILNGTANYILTKMTDQGEPFPKVLKEAQALGYAEADPTFDIEGIDTAHKLTILLSIAYGIPINFKAVYTEGISKVTPLDIKFMKEFGYRIKLLAISKDDGEAIEARVHPTLIPNDTMLANVNEAYNALYIKGDAVGNVMLYGPGAGMMPTGSAVVSDLVDVARNILNGTHGRVPLVGYQPASVKARRVKSIEELEAQYYFRFSAEDRPGVLSKISGILGKHQISIKSVHQKGRDLVGAVPIVMITHKAKEAGVRMALSEIDHLDVVKDKTILIRIEDER